MNFIRVFRCSTASHAAVVISKLKRIQLTAAQILRHQGLRHVISVLRDLHWLSNAKRARVRW